MPYQPPETPGTGELLRRFGAELRRCRTHAGWTQTRLADYSGVSQSTISRLERGRAPMAAMVKLVRLSDVLGTRFPLGYCPPDHDCAWERLDADGRPEQRQAAVGRKDLFEAMFGFDGKD